MCWQTVKLFKYECVWLEATRYTFLNSRIEPRDHDALLTAAGHTVLNRWYCTRPRAKESETLGKKKRKSNNEVQFGVINARGALYVQFYVIIVQILWPRLGFYNSCCTPRLQINEDVNDRQEQQKRDEENTWKINSDREELELSKNKEMLLIASDISVSVRKTPLNFLV